MSKYIVKVASIPLEYLYIQKQKDREKLITERERDVDVKKDREQLESFVELQSHLEDPDSSGH